MAKIGLYRDPTDGAWYIPSGAAPSTHIVKAGSESFPHETLNEAVCLETARLCGFDVVDFELMDVGGGQPLFAARRYDRDIPELPRMISGLPAPVRLHQEDFGQALRVPTQYKYEPTDGRYLEKAVGCASSCAEPFGESMLVMQCVLFGYLVGNADDHLKNFALLYGHGLSSPTVAPLYDVVSTAAYENVFSEMGVSFGGSRRFDDVSRAGIEAVAARTGLPVSLVMGEFDELAESVPTALDAAARCFASEGFSDAEYVAETIKTGVESRRSFERVPAPFLKPNR